METYFDPRDTRCKTPFGAAPCSTEVRFTLFDDTFCGCELLVYREFAGAEDVCPLPPAEGGFAGTYTAPGEGELCWYVFRLTRWDGTLSYLGKNGLRPDRDGAERWQLTVYEDTGTPDWFGQGVTYQIFPDRFRRTGTPDVSGMVGRRWLHESWDDQPVFRPDEDGQITNRDFFGGSLAGITEKLDYLQSLSVTTLYLNPIFEAASNHRYDTADYRAIDPLLGDEETFRTLCREAHKRGMRVMLDGVFNHTGSRSRYFNADGFYPELGAAQSQDSPYYDWYSFHPWPTDYDAWWGVKTLPAVNEQRPAYRQFIFKGEDSVVRHWLRCGADGWRLDVADELPGDFIAGIRRAIEDEKPDGYLLGEVWEDGSNKVAYSQRRRYLLGRETHGLMNYPLRTALLRWLGGGDAAEFRESMETLRANYPPAAFYGAMNFLGTHDTPRILTLLGAEHIPAAKEERAAFALSPAQLARGRAKLRLAGMLLYGFPGSPTLFYGDEAGMQGFEDPLNRGTYPWGREDTGLLDFFRALGRLRKERRSLQSGSLTYIYAQGGGLVITREHEGETTMVALNAGDEVLTLTLPWPRGTAEDGLTGQRFLAVNGQLRLSLPPLDGVVLI
ncbi:MAG: glycoside hydrolase family 13 protein [Clostridiales bacterium]|nr:glycoside hydrolase family 13 protein [Clostridiales bacterium]